MIDFFIPGGQSFRLNDNTSSNGKLFAPEDLPSNMEEVNAAEMSTTIVDRYGYENTCRSQTDHLS